MMQCEFEELTGCTVTPGDYRLIELVYEYNPVIKGKNPKKVIAELYKIGGMPLIKQMYPTAEKGFALYQAMEKSRAIYEEARKELELFQDTA